jgi:NAD(P)-dependent dehydrogenase (short-subunit alcohol dehydrogenase family)
MFEFLDKKVIVVGAGTGIGRSVAIKFAKKGANVACLSKNEINCSETASLAGKKAFAVGCDVSEYSSVVSSMGLAMTKLGGVDILVNTAGINVMAHTHQSMTSDFDNIIKTNLNGTYYTCKLALAYMIQNHNGGCIINTSSMAVDMPLPWSAAYVASKAGIVGLTKELAYEYKKANIRVNSVSPGGVDTPFVPKQDIPKDADFNLLSKFMDDLIPADDVAELYLYLASDKAKNINGSVFNIDRGVSV